MFGIKTKKDKQIEELRAKLDAMYFKHPHIITTQGNVIALGAVQILEDGIPTDLSDSTFLRMPECFKDKGGLKCTRLKR